MASPNDSGPPQHRPPQSLSHNVHPQAGRAPPPKQSSVPPQTQQAGPPAHATQPQHYTPPAATVPPPESKEQKVKRFFKHVRPQNATPPEPAPRHTLAELLTQHGDNAAAITETLASQGAWADVVSVAAKPGYYPSLAAVHTLLTGAPEEVSATMKDLARRVHIHAIAKVRTAKPAEALKILAQGDTYGVYTFGCGREEGYLCLKSCALEVAPFSMRLLRAGLEEGTTPLYLLAAAVEGVEDGDVAWVKRRRAVLVKLAEKLGEDGDLAAVLKILTDLCNEDAHSGDIQLQHKRIAALMQIGLITEAETAIRDLQARFIEEQKGEGGDGDGLTSTRRQHFERTISMLFGILSVCRGDVATAETHFSEGTDDACTVAMNNRAVCSVYSERLPEAIVTLEKCVAANPAGLTEIATQNLCSLYDMESEAPAEKKSRLFAVAEAYKGLDFVYEVQSVKPAS